MGRPFYWPILAQIPFKMPYPTLPTPNHIYVGAVGLCNGFHDSSSPVAVLTLTLTLTRTLTSKLNSNPYPAPNPNPITLSPHNPNPNSNPITL